MQRIAFTQRPSSLKSHPTTLSAARQRRSRCLHVPKSSSTNNPLYSDQERVIDVAALLSEVREENADFVFADFDDEEPVWEHEHRFKGQPMTLDELQAPAPQLFQPDPLAGVAEVVSAYSAEQGFSELSAGELSVALTAGGLVDLLLDVRSRAEFEAGPCIPGAVNIPLEQLSDDVRAGQLDRYITGHHVAVVCASGQRSAQATVRLTKVFGFERVSNVRGGMAAWVDMQQDLQKGSGGGGCGCGSGGCH